MAKRESRKTSKKEALKELRAIDPMRSLPAMVNCALAMEDARTRIQIGLSHLANLGRTDPERQFAYDKLVAVEEHIDSRVAALIVKHPAYPWFSRIRGIGRENIAKIIGMVRIRPSDEFICINKVEGKLCGWVEDKNGRTEPPLCPVCGERMKDPGWAHTISALWKYAGYAPDADGKAMKRVKGVISPYNARLKTMCWRAGSSIMKAGLRSQCSVCGKLLGAKLLAEHKCKKAKYKKVGASFLGAYYLSQKQSFSERMLASGKKIVPAEKLPLNADKKRYEPPDMISEGHVHDWALRKMIKLFLGGLWLVWRRAEGLPVTMPYAIEKLGHSTFIDPWIMVDREGTEQEKK